MYRNQFPDINIDARNKHQKFVEFSKDFLYLQLSIDRFSISNMSSSVEYKSPNNPTD